MLNNYFNIKTILRNHNPSSGFSLIFYYYDDGESFPNIKISDHFAKVSHPWHYDALEVPKHVFPLLRVAWSGFRNECLQVAGCNIRQGAPLSDVFEVISDVVDDLFRSKRELFRVHCICVCVAVNIAMHKQMYVICSELSWNVTQHEVEQYPIQEHSFVLTPYYLVSLPTCFRIRKCCLRLCLFILKI